MAQKGIAATVEKLTEPVIFRRGLAILFHLLGIVFSFWLAFQLRFDFQVPDDSSPAFYKGIWWIALGFFAAFLAFGLQRGLWRFFTLRDCFITSAAILVGAVLAGGTFFLVNGMSFEGFPRSTLIITSVLLLLWEVGCRGLIRLFREHRIRRYSWTEGGNGGVLLVGNPDEADALLRQLLRYPNRIGKVVGLVSNSIRHQGQQLRGIRIFSERDDFAELVRAKKVSMILFLPPLNRPATIRRVMEEVSSAGLSCDYRFMPSIDDLASGRLNVDQMRKVSIEDLLHRPTHKINMEMVASSIAGKRIMVTGAGGSIGSEICRQIIELGPSSLTLYEASELSLFQIERELAPIARASGVKLLAIIGDIRRPLQVSDAIQETGGIDVIYHAAAYKHVHLMEVNPMACFQNNVIGTEVVAGVAEKEGVSEFVLVSTDKAVRPTSLMGASKRLAERTVIERPAGNTRFKAVRFGNVLGSSGSVVPIFEQQIKNGGPVTVTSENVTRFFMTIPEAVELVIAAGSLSEDRTICVLEMGEPVKIDQLARRMIELSGFVPEVDIPIEYIGLKPGEKEYEELLTDDEGVVRTEYDRIWVVKKNDDASTAEKLDIGELLELIDDAEPSELRQYAHSRIPGSLLLSEG